MAEIDRRELVSVSLFLTGKGLMLVNRGRNPLPYPAVQQKKAAALSGGLVRMPAGSVFSHQRDFSCVSRIRIGHAG
jgi:hypothetical protein